MMKTTAILAACLLGVTGAAWPAEPAAREPVVVMELFTSEGCSSCPSAEALLNEWVAYAREHESRIYPLAFHVDYWNKLGWADRFSSPKFTQRQADYARAMQLPNVYTPQLVINGREQFVGSDGQRAGDIVRRELRREATVTVTLKVEPAEDKHSLRVQCAADGEMDGRVLNIAVVERGLRSKVKAGENKGKTLAHENVVRVFKTIQDREAAGGIVVTLPEDLKREQASVIAYAQDPTTLAIAGAAAVDLTQ